MCTLEKCGAIFILILTDLDQHRLNPTLIASLRSALSQAKAQYIRRSTLITITDDKFFSNGFDLDWAQASGSLDVALDQLVQMVDLFKPVVADLISLPMLTISAVTSHVAATRMLLGLNHDYVLMRRDRGVLYMSEIDIGLTLPDYFLALFRSKVARRLLGQI